MTDDVWVPLVGISAAWLLARTIVWLERRFGVLRGGRDRRQQRRDDLCASGVHEVYEFPKPGVTVVCVNCGKGLTL